MNEAERRLAEQQELWERAEREAMSAFFEAVSNLVENTHGNLYAIGDGRGGWCLEVISEALYERHVPEWKKKLDRAVDDEIAFSKPGSLTSLHRHLHRLGDRDGWNCTYCGCQLGCPCNLELEPAVSDHVFPKSRGGSDDDSNRVLACRACNQSKLDRTPDEWGGP